MSNSDLTIEKNAIQNTDIVIVGHSSTKSLPLFNYTGVLRASSHFHVPTESLVFPEVPAGDTSISQNKLLIGGGNTVDEDLFAYQVLSYAKQQGKKTIFISLLAPYDLPNYQSVADAMLAGYDHYGYLVSNDKAYYRGPSMPVLTRIIFGFSQPRGKLPVKIPDPNAPETIIYPRGFGL